MAKAKLAALTEKWIDGKNENQLNLKTGRKRSSAERVMQTLYLSREAVKLLWHNRAETGEPISHTVDKLVMEHLGKKGA